MIIGRPFRACALLNASVIIGELSVRIVVPMDMKKLVTLSHRAHTCWEAQRYTHPNVAADPSMYWPNVRSIPFGPGPYRIMFVAPNMKPMIKPTAIFYQSVLLMNPRFI